MDENVCEEEVECCDECGNPTDSCDCCVDCGNYPCECCKNCGMYPCECCENCGCWECECSQDEESGSMGSSDVPGWVARGHKSVSCVSTDSGWQRVWPEIDAKNFDPCVEASNFYLLEAIANNVPNRVRPVKAITVSDDDNDAEMLKKLGVSKSKQQALIARRDKMVAERRDSDPDYDLAWLMRDATVALDEVVDRADATLVGYFHMACAGEARHHRAIGGTVLTGGHNRAAAWVGWRTVYEQVGPEAIKDIAVLLGEITGGTYGGALWKQAAEILYERVTGTLGPDERTTKRLFVDRAWTLEHNGGCFLNKIEWACKNKKGWGLDGLKSRVLNAHAENPANWRVLCQAASPKIVEMFDRYWEITNRQRELAGMEPVPNPRSNVKTRIMCNGCWSDPARGHLNGCKSLYAEDFDGGDLSEVKKWFVEVEEDEWGMYNWSKWHQKEYPIGPDGSITVHELDMVKVHVSVRLERHLKGNSADSDIWRNFDFKKQMTVKELRECDDLLDVTVSEYLTNGHELGWKEDDEVYSVTIHFRIVDNETGTKIVTVGLGKHAALNGVEPSNNYLSQEALFAMLDDKLGQVNLGQMLVAFAPNVKIIEATEAEMEEFEAKKIRDEQRRLERAKRLRESPLLRAKLPAKPAFAHEHKHATTYTTTTTSGNVLSYKIVNPTCKDST